MVIDERLEQPLNARFEIFFTVEGMTMLSSPVQYSKAPSLISSNPS